MTKLLSVPTYNIGTIYLSDPQIEPIYFEPFLVFFRDVHSYLIQLFSIFQSKLFGSIMNLHLDVVNPQEDEQEEGLEPGESFIQHFQIQIQTNATNGTMYLLGQPI